MSKRIDWKRLKQEALSAQELAFAPYSAFPVGAAILIESGEIVRGCNVENASFGLTICAERAAIFSAIAQGFRNFQAIAICASPLAPPCGACRQVIVEFGDAIEILSFDSRQPERVKRWKSGKLLPERFQFRAAQKGDRG